MNPLTKLGPMRTSKKPQRPTPEQPVPEAYAGHNNPYRGVEAHGVEPTEEPLDELDYSDGRLVEYEEPEQQPEPVPVRVVTEGSRELKKFRPVVAHAGGTDRGRPFQILGADDTRDRATIHNNNTATVYIGSTPEEASVANGFPIEENGTYATSSQDELYAFINQAAIAEVRIAIEYTVGVPSGR